MTLRHFTIALMVGGLIAVLAWLIRGRRDEYIEYPDEPQPVLPWWTWMEDISTAEPWQGIAISG